MRFTPKNISLLAMPVLMFVYALPGFFADSVIQYGAAEMVVLTPDLNKIDKQKIYPECPDELFTYETFLDSMTGSSLKLRLFYNKFGLGKFAAHAADYVPNGSELDMEEGRRFIQTESSNFELYLKKAKSKFWKQIGKEAKAKKIGMSQIKKEFKETLLFESALIEDLLKMNDQDLAELTEMFSDIYSSDYKYWSGESDFSEDTAISFRKRVNNYMLSMANMYKWRTRLFVMQSNGENAMDYGWYLNISTMVKYRSEKSERAILLQLKRIIKILL